MRLLILLAVLASPAVPGRIALAQQSGARAEVEAVVTRLFDGMRASDSAAVRSVFHPEARLGSALLRDGSGSYRPAEVDGFVRAVGAPKTAIWDERIANLRIEVNEPLATAWMDYRFYAGERFSHCGVNAMQLVRMPAGWQIVSLVDTRQQEGCPPWG
jgi:hypothetical protein